MATATNVIFPWRESYSVGIVEIDNQHKGLIRQINNLQQAMMDGNGKQMLSATINELIRYTEKHFAYEEALLQKQGYSGLQAHQQQHRELTRQVYELRDKFQTGELLISMEVMRFLKNWLADHILERDRAYAKELNRSKVPH